MKILQHDIISDIWKLNVFNIMYYFALLWFSDITQWFSKSDFSSSPNVIQWFKDLDYHMDISWLSWWIYIVQVLLGKEMTANMLFLKSTYMCIPLYFVAGWEPERQGRNLLAECWLEPQNWFEINPLRRRVYLIRGHSWLIITCH